MSDDTNITGEPPIDGYETITDPDEIADVLRERGWTIEANGRLVPPPRARRDDAEGP